MAIVTSNSKVVANRQVHPCVFVAIDESSVVEDSKFKVHSQNQHVCPHLPAIDPAKDQQRQSLQQ